MDRSRHNAADLLRRHCRCGFLFAANNYVCCSPTWKAAPESSLARLWLFAWLLPRAMERRWFWALLDTDTHWTTLELRIGKGTTAIENWPRP
jgi:hypothetical protein